MHSIIRQVLLSFFIAGFAEVEVDLDTVVASVLNYVAVADCGTVINENLARVQVEGGIVMGIGLGLYEDVRYSSKGRLATSSFMEYKIPAIAQVIHNATVRPELDQYDHIDISDNCFENSSTLPAAVYLAGRPISLDQKLQGCAPLKLAQNRSRFDSRLLRRMELRINPSRGGKQVNW